MLVTFKSKAAANLLMYEENAKQILDLLDKDVKKGIITAEQTGSAIEILEKEMAKRKIEEDREKTKHEENEEKDRLAGNPKKREDLPVGFSTRVYPFLQMLKAAHKRKKDIVWGVVY